MTLPVERISEARLPLQKLGEMQDIFDPTSDNAFIDAMFASKGVLSETAGSVYTWAREFDRRLWHQNRNAGWGEGNRVFHESLVQDGFSPRRIAEIGVNDDATLVENIARAYQDVEEIYVIEIDPVKLAGAQKTLEKEMPEEAVRGRIQWIAGDAVVELPKLPLMDLIDEQLLLIHLPEVEEAPDYWDEEVRGRFTSTQVMIGTSEKCLTRKGRKVTHELVMPLWDGKLKKGYENDLRAQQGVGDIHTFIHGNRDEGGSFPGALFLGWDSRKANAWKSRSHISGTILKYAPSLRFRQDLSRETQVPDGEPGSVEAVLLDYMSPTIPSALDSAIATHKKALEWAEGERRARIEAKIPILERISPIFWEMGEKYHRGANTEGVLSVSPPLVHMVFEKM
jgi:hypothetical protein